MAGNWISISEAAGQVIWPSGEKLSRMGLGPISTMVLMYSRPWMPSRVGRTISDMSVQIESNPGPENRPRYPAPETGIRPVSAWFQVVAMISGFQYSSPMPRNSGFTPIDRIPLVQFCTHDRHALHS